MTKQMLSGIVKGLKFLLCLPTSKLASHSFMSASRRHETPGQRQRALSLKAQQAAWASCSQWFPWAPSPMGEMQIQTQWDVVHICVYVTAEELWPSQTTSSIVGCWQALPPFVPESHCLYYPHQETNLPSAPEGLSLSFKAVLYTYILQEAVRDKSCPKTCRNTTGNCPLSANK